MRKLIIIRIATWLMCWCIMVLYFISPVYAEKIPALREIPKVLSLKEYEQFSQQKQNLEKELAEFQAAADTFNGKVAKEQSDAEYERLYAWRSRYINSVKAFHQAVAQAQRIEEQRIEKVQKAWRKALSCAMEDVYSRAESLGPDGESFSKKLRNEMTRVFNEAGKPVKEINEDNIVTLDLDRQESISISTERQYIVKVAVHSLYDNNIHIDVQSYFSISGNKKDRQELLSNIIQINKSGEIMAVEESEVIKTCLAH